MRFSYKMKKLVTGEGLASAGRHLRYWMQSPARLDFNAARITATIDAEKLREVRQRYAMTDPGDDWPKYLDIERWMEINLRRVRDLELDLGRRRRILDIGCGAGYFLYICKRLGHEVLGIDIDEGAGFRDFVKLLGVPRRIWRVEPFLSLPQNLGQFDVITAHMICFNGHKTDKLWTIAEWEFFLNDAAGLLRPGGIIGLELNREFDGSLYTPDLKRYFESRGARIHTQRVVFDPWRAATGVVLGKPRR